MSISFSADLETWGRLAAIAERDGVALEDLVPQILERGIGLFEKTNNVITKRKPGKPRGEKVRKQKFIRDNYETMSDEEMAQMLHVSDTTIRQYRSGMSLSRAKAPRPVQQESISMPAFLTEEQKIFISNNLSLSNHELGVKFGVRSILISKYRCALLEKYLESIGQDKPVVETAAKFGMNPVAVSRVRISLGLDRPQRYNKTDLSCLGSKEEILFALTRGGKTVVDLLKEHSINLSRQRLEQILANRFGIAVGCEDRTPEWHARRMAGGNEELFQKLVDKQTLEAKLYTTSISALSAELGLEIGVLIRHLKDCLHIDISLALSNKRTTELVCSNPDCDKPDRKFFRQTKIVRRDRKINPNKPTFCSRQCFGHCAGNNVGFVAHPENLRKGGRKKKQDVTKRS